MSDLSSHPRNWTCPGLQGGLLTTRPWGKSHPIHFFMLSFFWGKWVDQLWKQWIPSADYFVTSLSEAGSSCAFFFFFVKQLSFCRISISKKVPVFKNKGWPRPLISKITLFSYLHTFWLHSSSLPEECLLYAEVLAWNLHHQLYAKQPQAQPVGSYLLIFPKRFCNLSCSYFWVIQPMYKRYQDM